MTDTALLIIDMQKAMFSDPEKQPADGAAVLQNIRSLLKSAREKEIPVIFVQHTAQGKYREGTPTWELCGELERKPDEPVVQKTKPDAFLRTDLQGTLERLAVRRLLITGMQSDCCVRATCLGALKYGYRVTLVSDAHSTFSGFFTDGRRMVEKINRALSKKGVTLRPTARIFA